MTATTRADAAHPPEENDLKAQISKHCVETAVNAVNRICDYRIKEVDSVVEQYLEMLPAKIRQQPLSSS